MVQRTAIRFIAIVIYLIRTALGGNIAFKPSQSITTDRTHSNVVQDGSTSDSGLQITSDRLFPVDREPHFTGNPSLISGILDDGNTNDLKYEFTGLTPGKLYIYQIYGANYQSGGSTVMSTFANGVSLNDVFLTDLTGVSPVGFVSIHPMQKTISGVLCVLWFYAKSNAQYNYVKLFTEEQNGSRVDPMNDNDALFPVSDEKESGIKCFDVSSVESSVVVVKLQLRSFYGYSDGIQLDTQSAIASINVTNSESKFNLTPSYNEGFQFCLKKLDNKYTCQLSIRVQRTGIDHHLKYLYTTSSDGDSGYVSSERDCINSPQQEGDNDLLFLDCTNWVDDLTKGNLYSVTFTHVCVMDGDVSLVTFIDDDDECFLLTGQEYTVTFQASAYTLRGMIGRLAVISLITMMFTHSFFRY